MLHSLPEETLINTEWTRMILKVILSLAKESQFIKEIILI